MVHVAARRLHAACAADGSTHEVPMRLKYRTPTFALCAMVAVFARTAEGQGARRELVGVVRDAAGAAIEGAIVEIPGAAARTDARGAFRLQTADSDTLTISIRRLGYSAASSLLTARNRQWDTVQVEMERNSPRLSAVNIRESTTRRALGLRDFEERRANGMGVFITRDEIVARNSSRLSDVLRNKRGVKLIRLRDGTYGARFVSRGEGPAGCSPDIWLDGQRARGLEIDDVPAADVEAMELYESSGSIPFQFTPQSANTKPCSTIVIWTRIPGG